MGIIREPLMFVITQKNVINLYIMHVLWNNVSTLSELQAGRPRFRFPMVPFDFILTYYIRPYYEPWNRPRF
jgi:hypothetical protein